jgi:hypothetical protein
MIKGRLHDRPTAHRHPAVPTVHALDAIGPYEMLQRFDCGSRPKAGDEMMTRVREYDA